MLEGVGVMGTARAANGVGINWNHPRWVLIGIHTVGIYWNGEAGKRWLGEVVMGRNMGRGREEEGHLETTAEIRMVDR